MKTPIQIEIIKLLGNKELSFGCLIETKYGIGKIGDEDGHTFTNGKFNYRGWYKLDGDILGHLPTLEDLFIKASEYDHSYNIAIHGGEFIYSRWDTKIKKFKYNPKLKPYQQTEETMEKILTLFK